MTELSPEVTDQPISVEDLFRELQGQSFSSNQEFEDVVIGVFNAHLSEFPPHYSYRDAITWADRQGWLEVDGSAISVDIPDSELTN